MTALAFRAAWEPPPPAPALFGELSLDGFKIILISQGDAWDARTAGARLSALTPAGGSTALLTRRGGRREFR